jgi:hypothetical protein
MTIYTFDPTGVASANHVAPGPAMPINTVGQTVPQLNFLPDALFYATGFSLAYTDADGATSALALGDDYSFLLELDGLAANASKAYAAIVINRFDLNGTIAPTYQAVGGNFVLDKLQIIRALNGEVMYNDRVAFLTLKPREDAFLPGQSTPIVLNSAAAVTASQTNAAVLPQYLVASVAMLARSKRFYVEGGLVRDGNGVKV